MGPHSAAAEPFSYLTRQRGLTDTGLPDENDAAERRVVDGVHRLMDLCRAGNERPLQWQAAFPR